MAGKKKRTMLYGIVQVICFIRTRNGTHTPVKGRNVLFAVE